MLRCRWWCWDSSPTAIAARQITQLRELSFILSEKKSRNNGGLCSVSRQQQSQTFSHLQRCKETRSHVVVILISVVPHNDFCSVEMFCCSSDRHRQTNTTTAFSQMRTAAGGAAVTGGVPPSCNIFHFFPSPATLRTRNDGHSTDYIPPTHTTGNMTSHHRYY